MLRHVLRTKTGALTRDNSCSSSGDSPPPLDLKAVGASLLAHTHRSASTCCNFFWRSPTYFGGYSCCARARMGRCFTWGKTGNKGVGKRRASSPSSERPTTAVLVFGLRADSNRRISGFAQNTYVNISRPYGRAGCDEHRSTGASLQPQHLRTKDTHKSPPLIVPLRHPPPCPPSPAA